MGGELPSRARPSFQGTSADEDGPGNVDVLKQAALERLRPITGCRAVSSHASSCAGRHTPHSFFPCQVTMVPSAKLVSNIRSLRRARSSSTSAGRSRPSSMERKTRPRSGTPSTGMSALHGSQSRAALERSLSALSDTAVKVSGTTGSPSTPSSPVLRSSVDQLAARGVAREKHH